MNRERARQFAVSNGDYHLWSSKEVVAFLDVIEMSKYGRYFMYNDIRGDVLDDLTLSHLKEIGIKSLGDRIRINGAIQRLKRDDEMPAVPQLLNECIPPSPQLTPPMRNTYLPSKNRDSLKVDTSRPQSVTFVTDQTSPTLSKSSQEPKSPGIASSSFFFPSGSPHVAVKSIITSALSSFLKPSKPHSPEKLDVMQFETVRRRCIRVYDTESHMHVINVSSMMCGADIMDRILKKFNVLDDGCSYALYSLAGGEKILLDEDEIWNVCRLDSQRPERAFLLLEPIDDNAGTESLKEKPDVNQDFVKQRPPSDVISVNMGIFFPEFDGWINCGLPNSSYNKCRPHSMFDPFRSRLQSRVPIKTRPSSLYSLEGSQNFQSVSQRCSLLNDAIAEDDCLPGTSLNCEQPISWIQGDIIGRGSQATVYYGINIDNSHQIMAVKQVELPQESDSVAGYQRRQQMNLSLQTEIALLKQLQHKNIVKYLGSMTDGLHLTLFLEYVDGGSIAGIIAQNGVLDTRVAANFTRQVLVGLQFLHQNEVVHRDIKGSNILVTSENIVKLSDFGVSKLVDSVSSSQSQRFSVQGSIYWMAPELVTCSGLSYKVDIWSCGCLLIEMLTGKHPWSQFDPIQALYRIGQGDQTPFTAAKLDKSSADVDKFLTAALQVNPDNRPSAQDLLLFDFLHEAMSS